MSLGLATLSDLARHLEAALGLLAVGSLAWAVGVPLLGRRESARPTAGLGTGLLLAALLVRLPLLTLPPSLSDDALRYVWDGRVAAAGANPYRLAPEAEELAPLRDGLWRRLPHRDVPTVYPPVALAAFSIAAATPSPLATWKAVVTAADLAACALLLLLVRRRGLPASTAAWYALCPLVALETAGMGHVDGLAVAPMVAAVLWLRSRPPSGKQGADRREERDGPGRPLAAGAVVAVGALAKLGPLAALPMWARQSRHPGRFLAAALGLAAAGLLPVVVATGGVPPGLVAYGVSWEFNGPLYEPLWRLLGRLGVPALAVGAVDAAKEATGFHAALNRIYPYLYPQLLAKLLLAAGMAAALVRSLTERDAVVGARRLFGALLLCSATVYPWYLLWVLPWAALTRHRPWLLAAALMPLVYLPQLRDVALFPGVWAAVWGPPALLAAAGRWGSGPGDEPVPAAAEGRG